MERLTDLAKNTQLINGRFFRPAQCLLVPSQAGSLYYYAFCHWWQNILRKWKKGPKLGVDFSWFASSSSITLGGSKLWDELFIDMSYPGVSWNNFLCGFIMNPTSVGSSPCVPGFSFNWKTMSWNWKQMSTTTKDIPCIYTLRLCYI